MRGKYGTPMTVVRVAARPAYETADRVCPVCFSVPGEPCRRVVSAAGARKLRLRGRLPAIHPERRG